MICSCGWVSYSDDMVVPAAYRQKDVFYFACVTLSLFVWLVERSVVAHVTHWSSPPCAWLYRTGCTVFWGLTRTEEQGHLRALTAFSVGPVKQIEVEDMDYTYGEATRCVVRYSRREPWTRRVRGLSCRYSQVAPCALFL